MGTKLKGSMWAGKTLTGCSFYGFCGDKIKRGHGGLDGLRLQLGKAKKGARQGRGGPRLWVVAKLTQN